MEGYATSWRLRWAIFMKVTRRTFVQQAALLSATLRWENGRLWGAETSLANASETSAANRKSREILFTPGKISERGGSYDRYEILQKAPQNPVFTAEKPWEVGGIGWGSVLRSHLDGKFKFIYGTSFPKARTRSARTSAASPGPEAVSVGSEHVSEAGARPVSA